MVCGAPVRWLKYTTPSLDKILRIAYLLKAVFCFCVLVLNIVAVVVVVVVVVVLGLIGVRGVDGGHWHD